VCDAPSDDAAVALMYAMGSDCFWMSLGSTGERKSSVSVIPPPPRTYSVFVGVSELLTSAIDAIGVDSPVGFPIAT
jgi:hypothetical protein